MNNIPVIIPNPAIFMYNNYGNIPMGVAIFCYIILGITFIGLIYLIYLLILDAIGGRF